MKTNAPIKMMILFLFLLILGITGSAQDAPIPLPEGDNPLAALETRSGDELAVILYLPQYGVITTDPQNVLSWTWSAQIVDKFIIKFIDVETGEKIKIKPKAPQLACIDDGVGGLYCEYTMIYDTLKLLRDNHKYWWTVTAKVTFNDTDAIKSKSGSVVVKVDLIKDIAVVAPSDQSTSGEPIVVWAMEGISTDTYRIKVKDVATDALVMNSIITPVCHGIFILPGLPAVSMCEGTLSGLTKENTYKVWVIASNEYGKSKTPKHTFTYSTVEIDVK